MRLLAAALASASLLASPIAQADPSRLREDVRRVAPALDKYAQERVLGDVWKRPGLSPARPQRGHARCPDCAQPDHRDAVLSRPCARQRRQAARDVRDHHASGVLRGMGQCDVGGDCCEGCLRGAQHRCRPDSCRFAAASRAQRSGRSGPRKARRRSVRRRIPGHDAVHDRRSVPRSVATPRPGAARPQSVDDQRIDRERSGRAAHRPHSISA